MTVFFFFSLSWVRWFQHLLPSLFLCNIPTMPVSAGTNQIHVESIEIEGSQPFTYIRGDPSTPVVEAPSILPVTASYDLEVAAATGTVKIKAENNILEREKLMSMQKMMASFLQGALQDKREVSWPCSNSLISSYTPLPFLSVVLGTLSWPLWLVERTM